MILRAIGLPSIVVALALGTPTTTHSNDMKMMAGMAGLGGILILTLTGNDIVQSTTMCTQLAATAGTPAHAGAQANDAQCASRGCACAMMALNIAAFGAAAYSILANSKSKSATDSGRVGSIPNFNPNLPLVNQLNPACSNNPAECGCTPENSIGNPACDPEAFKNLAGNAQRFRQDVQDGKIANPDGKDLSEDLAKLDTALGQLAALTSGEGASGADSGEIAGGALGFGESTGAGSGRGASFSTSFKTEGSGSASGSGAGRVGPASTEGLGNAIPLNGLTMVDELTGKELTLWQRATRRYQGDQGSRALRLARVEYTRQEVKTRKLALEQQFQEQSRKERQKALVRAAHKDTSIASAASRKAMPAIQAPPKKPQRLERN